MSDGTLQAIIDVRKQFEQRIAGATAVPADQVFRSPAWPLSDERLPGILIYSGDEDFTDALAAPRELQREARIWVEVIGVVRQEFADFLDLVASQVVAVIHAEETLGGLVADAVCRRIERSDPSRRGRFTIASLRLGFDMTMFLTYEDTTEAPEISSAGVLYDLAPPDGTYEAEDDLDLSGS